MTIPKMLNILRNPWGATEGEKEAARLLAADIVEEHVREKERWRLRQHAGIINI